MSMPPSDAQPTWTVTGQTERDQVVPGSAPVKGQQVFFQTRLGQQGSVFIPYTEYTTTNIVAKVGQQAAQLDAVRQLTGGTDSY